MSPDRRAARIGAGVVYDARMERSGRGLKNTVPGSAARVAFLCLLAALSLPAAPGSAAVSTPPQASTRSPEPVSQSVTGTRLETPPAVAADSWSRRDLLGAKPTEPEVGPGEAFDLPDLGDARSSVTDGAFTPAGTREFPLRTHGRVFFRVESQEYVCSGTVINSRGRNVVFTAGHCVYDRETGRYVDELIFVPAYQGNAPDPEPFGIWPAAAVFTSRLYVQNGTQSHDIGAVVLDDRIQDTVGARPIAFGLDPANRRFTIFGYPVKPDPPYDGETMIGCRSQMVNRDPQQGRPFPVAAGPCDMRGGSSGGGWITAGGYLNSVVSYGYCEDVPSLCGLTFGPYFGGQAKDIYTYPAVGGSAAPSVTIKSGPRNRIRGSAASFRFSGSGSTPVSFRCRLDGGSFSRCGSASTFRRLRRGGHALRVYAVDQTGRTSAKITTRRFGVTG